MEIKDAKSYFTDTVPAMLEKYPEKVLEAGATFSFNITGDGGGQWTMVLKGDAPALTEGLDEVDCAIEMTNDDFVEMMGNFQLSMQFFFSGRLKVTGNPMLATKLQSVLGG